MINIAEYAAYFHDGELVDIIQYGDSIRFEMISGELPENLNPQTPLSRDRCLRGTLVASQVRDVLVDKKDMSEPLKMPYDFGEIFNFKISGNVLKLMIIWANCFPPGGDTPMFMIEVKAGEIKWLPNPDLINPLEKREPPPGYSGHRVGPHCHMLNPNATNRQDKYLDSNGNAVAQGSKASRLKPPDRYTGNAFPADTTPLNGPINIIKYAGYFHDGSLTGLFQDGNRVDFTLISAEIDKRDRDSSVPNDFRLKGTLSLEGVRNIQVNRKPYSEPLKMKSEIADIYNLEISEHRLEIELTWETYLPHFKEVDWQTITMEYDRLTWNEKV